MLNVNFFRKLPSIGVKDNLDRLTIQKIRVTNGFFFMITPVLIYYAIYNLINYDGKFAAFYALAILMSSVVLGLNYYGKYEAAKIYSIIFNVLNGFILQYLFGSGLVLETIVIVFVVFSAYIIDSKPRAISLVMLISMGFILLKYFEQLYPAPYAERVLFYSPVILFVISVIVISYFIFERRTEIELHLIEKNNFEKRLKNINYELAKNKNLIEAQNVELEVKNNELNQFAYIAAHDLRTPIRSVLSFSQLAKMNLDKKNIGKVHEFLDIITTSSTHLNDLIKDLLSYSLLEKDSIDLELVDLNELFDSVVMLINDKLKTPLNIKATGLTTAYVNPLQFKLLFQNLIENGIKYNRDNVPEVMVKASQQNGRHYMQFIDNGIGIEDKYQEQIFEIFKRLHTSEEFEGSGLGLAICNKIMDRHHGTISVTRSSSAGTIFTIDWPCDLASF